MCGVNFKLMFIHRLLCFYFIKLINLESINLSICNTVGTYNKQQYIVALHSVKTGAGTLHCYETISGLRIALYTNNNPIMNTIGARGAGGDRSKTSFQTALKYIYSELWVECVVRSPLYQPDKIQGDPFEGKENMINSTNFEAKLDAYLKSMPWFKSV